MFKFKGISSNEMQVVVEEEEHFIARAAKRYEIIEIEGKDGAIFNGLGYSYIERPIYVQCLNIDKIDEILAWLNGEGEFEYRGRKTTARFYSQIEPQRTACIRIIDTTFIRDPFWVKANEDFILIKDGKVKSARGESINIKDSSNLPFKKFGIEGNTYQDLTPILPEEYTQLEYIEGTGKQYIDTGYLPKDTSKYELLGTIVDVPTSVRPVTYLFGENDEDDENTPEEQLYYSCYIKVNRLGKIEFEFGHDEYGNTLTLPPVSGYIGNKHKFILNKETAYIDNTLIGNFSETTLPFSKQKSLYLFALHYTDLGRVESAEIGPTTIQINNFKIYEGDSLKHNFIPCKRNSDNELGLYDYVTKAFKTNAGTGTFNAGPVSTLPNEDYQIPSIDYPSDVRAVGDNIQLFDKDNANILNAYFDSTSIKNLSATRTLYIPCKPNKTYTISKIKSARFAVCTTKEIPNNQIEVFDFIQNNELTEITTNTSNESKYICVFYYHNQHDITITEQEILDSIKICEGTETGSWSPYGMGSMEVSKSNKNILNSKLMIGIANINFIDIKVKPNTKWTFSSNIPKTYDGSNAFIFATTKKHNYTTAGNGVWEGQKRTITADEEGYISLGYRKDSNINSFDDYWYQIEEGEVATTPIPHESETYAVPTQEPFYEGDTFVKIDGVRYEKHLWEKYIFTGNETWLLNETGDNYIRYTTTIEGIITDIDAYKKYIKSNKFFSSTSDETVNANADKDRVCVVSNSRVLIKLINSDYSTADLWETYLAEQYSRGKPLYVVYKPAEPKLIPCTEEQNEILDEIENSSTYQNVTYIYSNDEISPVFDIEYLAITDETIQNEGNILSRPIIKLVKTISNEIELTINDCRFKYDFKDDDYVEIDCENKTVIYEGLKRNRNIEIGYDFPKLKIGENDIIMHKGDCIIEILRKDRWL